MSNVRSLHIGNRGRAGSGAPCIRRLGRASKPANRHTHTDIQSAQTKQANGQPTLHRQCSSTAPYKARHRQSAKADPPYACMPPASARLPAMYCTDQCRLVSAAGRRFITGTAARIRQHISPKRRFFSSPASAMRNFQPVPRRRRLGKGKSVAKFVADGCVRSVCVRVCAADKVCRKANCNDEHRSRFSA